METLFMTQLFVAGTLDGLFRKIPNLLTFAMAACGLMLQVSAHGLPGFLQGLGGLALGVGILYIPFVLGGVGGGDVKLLAAMGAWLGPDTLWRVFLAGAVVGGLFSLLEVLRRKAWRRTLAGLKYRLFYLLVQRRLPQESALQEPENALRIPYALSLLGGYLAYCYLGGVLPWTL